MRKKHLRQLKATSPDGTAPAAESLSFTLTSCCLRKYCFKATLKNSLGLLLGRPSDGDVKNKRSRVLTLIGQMSETVQVNVLTNRHVKERDGGDGAQAALYFTPNLLL